MEAKRFLNELNNFDFRVFICHFAFKHTQTEIADNLKVSRKKVNKTCQYLKNLYEFTSLTEELKDLSN